MPAQAMPSSGGQPPQPKTCDASGMAMIHRVFRSGFGEGPDLVRAVRAGDTAHADAVATQLNMLSVGLHAHHEGEDARLWGPLEERAPACAVHVERMKKQHAEMLVHLRELDGAPRRGAPRRAIRTPSCRPSTASTPRSPCTCPTRRRTSCR